MLPVVTSSGLPWLTWLLYLGSFGTPWAPPNLASSWGFFFACGVQDWCHGAPLPCFPVSGKLCSSCIPSLPGPVVSAPGGWFGDSGVLPLLKRLSWSESGPSLLILSLPRSCFTSGAQARVLPQHHVEVPTHGLRIPRAPWQVSPSPDPLLASNPDLPLGSSLARQLSEREGCRHW